MPAQRLIDLHCDWLLQYAGETTVFDPALYTGVEQRISQSAGYLQATSAAVLSCYRRAEDWARQPDPWKALGELITRLEAEFPGRLLIGPEDFGRWRNEPEGLCWGIIGVEGFDSLVREPHDLERLPALFDRGVRIFQPVYSENSALAGSSVRGDSRGLTDLGRAFLQQLADLPPGPCAAIDIAHMNPTAASEVLDWFESNPSCSDRLIPIYSHGALSHDGFNTPRAITRENIARLRVLGGVIGLSVGPPFYQSKEAIKVDIEAVAELPYLGRAGFEGIAIGTDFLGVDQTLPGVNDVEAVVAWIQSAFPPQAAAAILSGNAAALMGRLTCARVRGQTETEAGSGKVPDIWLRSTDPQTTA